MRNTLICTVGTSLFNNLKHSEGDIKQAFDDQNWNQISLLLLERKNSDRICGAEINSVTSICNRGLLAAKIKLIFLVSDTEDGKKTGSLLKLYYNNARNNLKFEQVEFRILTGLRDDDVKAFKQQGLKNLVREISIEVRNFSAEAIAINATGGYKAQISFAGMIGQALGIPVYYLFEKFSEVIELPPQPVSLDLAFWLNNYSLFKQLESEQTIERAEIEGDLENEYIQSLIDEEIVNGISLVSLSAMGMLFNERSRLQFARQETTLLSLIPKDETNPEFKAIHLRDDHGIEILQAFSRKICRSPYVKQVVNSLPFNPRSVKPIRRAYANGIVEFVLTWTNAGLGICIQTTGRNLAETNTIALYLENEFTH